MADQENLTESHWSLANPQRIEDLVKLGLVQLSDLPWLKRALVHMQADMFLPTPERQIFYTFISRLFTLALDDPTIFRLIRQRIIMSKYDTHEEVEMQEGRKRVKSLSGPDVKKAPEGMLDTFANIVRNKKNAGGHPTDADMAIASRARSELRRRRRHMGETFEYVQPQSSVVPADLIENENYDLSYQERLEVTLEHFELNSLQDVTPEIQTEFFNFLENINTTTGE